MERQTLNDEDGHALVGGLTATISTTRTGGKWAARYQIGATSVATKI